MTSDELLCEALVRLATGDPVIGATIAPLELAGRDAATIVETLLGLPAIAPAVRAALGEAFTVGPPSAALHSVSPMTLAFAPVLASPKRL